ncbi:MAG: response regulator [Gammaproteobacteria bacterium]|jgi:two-component system nitrate/nitrite response regulator NarL|nr:response regulator [Gammaproteobacteria bacterium]
MTMRVLIIDDHALFRVGLQELLTRRDITVIDAIGDGAEGVRIAQESQPDIVLLDLRMPVMDGLSVLRRLRETGLTMPVVMLTTSTEERDLVESLRNGAQGYLIKDMEPDEVVSALHEIVQGNTVVAPELTGVLAKVVQGGGSDELPPEDPFDELTPREREILCHVAEGQSNKVIARNLGISDGTVKLHVKAVLRKLGLHSRVEAAVMAVEHGLTHHLR